MSERRNVTRQLARESIARIRNVLRDHAGEFRG